MFRPNLPALGVVALLLAVSLAASASESAERRGLEVAQRVDAANAGYGTEVAIGELVLINAQGERAVRSLVVQRREVPDDGDQSVVMFTSPADVEGTKLLTWAHGKRDDDQWLYLPSIDRVKRISGRSKSGSFMGSEFAFEDLSTPEVEDYTYQFLETRQVDGHRILVYERYPRDEQSGYSREVVHIDSRYMYPVEIEYYNVREELLKRAEYDGFERYGEYWRPKVVTMTNLQNDKRSRMQWDERALGKDLRDASFRKESLGDW